MSICRLAGLGTLLVVVAALVGTSTTPAGGSPPAGVVLAPTSPSVGNVKHYVVGPPVNGQQEYLFDIATKTLGNGRRYLEIFALNQGRSQADGGRLEDPAVLRPGWVLLLPKDAAGAGVLVGPMPTFATDVSPRPDTDAIVSATSRVEPSTEPADLAPWHETALRVGALLAALALLALARRVLRDPRTRPSWRPATVDPAIPVGPGLPRPAAPVGTPQQRPPEPVTPPKPTAPPKVTPPPTPTPPPKPTPPPEPTAPPTRTAPPPEPTAPPKPTAPPPKPTGPPQPVALSYRAGPNPPPTVALGTHFVARVLHCSDLISVRLLGDADGARAATPTDRPPYVWLVPLDNPPEESVALYVGGDAGRSLYVRMSDARDIVTVTGESGARRRLARSIAEQAAAAGHLVTEVGDAASARRPLGVRHVDRLDRLELGRSTVEMVIYHPATGNLATLRALSRRSGRRPILVAVGDVPRGRWSFDAWPATMVDVPGRPDQLL